MRGWPLVPSSCVAASEPHSGLLPVRNPVPWRGLLPAQLARPVPGSHGWVRTHKYVEAVLNSVSKSCPENTGPCFEEGPAVGDPWCRWAGGRGGDRQAAQPPRVRRGRAPAACSVPGPHGPGSRLGTEAALGGDPGAAPAPSEVSLLPFRSPGPRSAASASGAVWTSSCYQCCLFGLGGQAGCRLHPRAPWLSGPELSCTRPRLPEW